MLVTTKGAGSMFCGPYITDHTGAQQKVAYCNGSLCMKWRWGDTKKTHGYCGLAGRSSIS